MQSFIELKNVKKTYIVGEQKFNALDGIDLSINRGEFVVILGPSGAGKSTLLNLLGGMDTPTAGSIMIGEDDIAKFDDKELTRYRAHDVGFIFQFYNIMPTLTVDENINLIKDVTNTSKDSASVLKSVGLSKHADKFPQELSGGEQQRVSIARAIVNSPKLLICDEPTGNLDPDTSLEIMKVLEVINDLGTTIIVVTHDRDIVNQMKKRVILLDKGRLKKDYEKGTYDKNEKH